MRLTLTTRNSRDRLAMILLTTEKFVMHRKFGITCEVLQTTKTHACNTENFWCKSKGQNKVLWKNKH